MDNRDTWLIIAEDEKAGNTFARLNNIPTTNVLTPRNEYSRRGKRYTNLIILDLTGMTDKTAREMAARFKGDDPTSEVCRRPTHPVNTPAPHTRGTHHEPHHPTPHHRHTPT